MDIELVQGAATLRLNGAGTASPFKAARFADAGLGELEVVMEAAAASLTAGVSTLSAWLFEAQRVDGDPGAEWVYVQVTLPDGSSWRSRLAYGQLRLAYGPAGRAQKAQTVSLALQRADWWETKSQATISLENGHGSGTGWIPFYNHDDGGHDNYATLGALSGDLPAPLQVTLWMVSVANNEAFVGMGAYVDLANLQTVFEGEASSAGAGVSSGLSSDATCSSSGYVTRSWSGTGVATLAYWSPAQPVISAFAGRFFRPLVRLPALVSAGERLWLQLKLGYDSGGSLEVVHETEPTLAPTDKRLVALPAVQLPPWATLNADSQPVSLMLTAWGESAGSHTLTLDYLALLPMDSYLHLIPRIASYPDFAISYDSERRVVKNNSRSMGTHVPEGDGLWAIPGRTNRIYLLNRAGTGCEIAHNPYVGLAYRPRRRTL